MDLGALPFTVFRRVTFPLIRPAMIATALFAFTLSFDEFVRTFFVVGTQRTVPVHLWILVTEEVAPFLPAVGVIIMLLTLTTAALGFASSSINSRRNARFAMARETARKRGERMAQILVLYCSNTLNHQFHLRNPG